MITIKEKAKCSGCYSCINICPKKCIEMREDEEGFEYPVVNKNVCINCNLCEKHCPIENKERNIEEPIAYAAINKNEEIRRESSSGGMFTLLAEAILDKGGVVYGAAFNDEYIVEHIKVTQKEDLKLLRGPKYVQSKIGTIYEDVRDSLQNGKWVYFTGTPCQVDGLLTYLGKEDSHLICQDIVCHGVPSPKIWKWYLKQIKLNNARISFRDKSTGWESYSFTINQKKKFTQYASDNLYMRAFVKNLSLRPSCYECQSKGIKRKSDITLGDFWGINKVCPEMQDGKGTSLIFVSSEKGIRLLNEIKDKIELRKVTIADAVKYNPAIIVSSSQPTERTEFMKKIGKGKFNKITYRYVKDPFLLRMKIMIYRAIHRK